MNIANYIWAYNAIIGTNEMVKEYTEEEREKYLKSNLTLYGNSRAMYSVRFNNAQLDVDVEDALSQIIEYMYYLTFKTRDDLYDNAPTVAQRFNETKSMSVLAVGFLLLERRNAPELTFRSLTISRSRIFADFKLHRKCVDWALPTLSPSSLQSLCIMLSMQIVITCSPTQ